MTDQNPLAPALPAVIEAPAGAVLDPAAIAERLEALAGRAARLAEKSRGPGTRRSYQSAWKHYDAWCHSLGREPLAGDPGLVALYLAERAGDLEHDPQAGLAVSSLGVARAAIRAQHRLHRVPIDMDDPRLQLVMAGIARVKGVRPRWQAAPAVPDTLRRLV